MKKIISGCVAGVIGLSAILATAACAPKEKADRDAPAFDDPAATLTIDATTDANKKDMRISEDLFGLFLEDINYASQALDDNLVANSNFAPTGRGGTTWQTGDMWKTSPGTTLTVETTAANLLNSTNESYAHVTASANGTLTNTGFEAIPMAVTSGVDYKLGFFIKNDRQAFDLTVTIKDGSNDYGSVTVNVKQNASWVKYERTIKATGTAAKDVVLELKFGAQANVLLDCVTLETTDATVGIKNYIYNALADLGPAFFRFPGGCIIEGASMESAYDWKNSIGAVAVGDDDKVEPFTYTLDKDGTTSEVTTRGEYATRKTNTNLWGTRSSNYYVMDYAIGFYDYFMLCESLGAGAIPIVNVGLSCQIQSGDSGAKEVKLSGRHNRATETLRVQDYIQDALDLVAFALGDPNSSDADEAYWAQVRADMGHSAPFTMKYLGVGNEQWSNTYYNYYQQFLEAFKAKAAENPLYGKVQLIVGNGPNFDMCDTYDEDGNLKITGFAKAAAKKYMNEGKIMGYDDYGIVDHHYYMGSMDFFSNTHFYDHYDRGADRYEVFVGEYSANNNAHKLSDGYKGYYEHKNNSWLTALAEAAYMTGLERNGDIVKLAAYAPMFGVASGTEYRTPNNQWPADMMFFTNTELLLTPNYHVQQIFMKNAGTLKVKSAELSFKAGEMPTTTYQGRAAETGDSRPVECTIDNIYQVVSKDEHTGDVIVKIVNAGEDTVNFNVTVGSAKLTGIAEVTELSNDGLQETSTLALGNLILPKSEKIGFKDGTFGYAIKPYSVTAFRIRTK